MLSRSDTSVKDSAECLAGYSSILKIEASFRELANLEMYLLWKKEGTYFSGTKNLFVGLVIEAQNFHDDLDHTDCN